jgi:outer membrane protein assembly factor BamB
VYAVDASTMDTVWEVNLSAANTGPAFMGFTGPTTSSNELYAAAADTVYRITDNGNNGTITWKAGVGDTVRSGPIALGRSAYCGSDGGRYHALDNTDGSARSMWPYTQATGDATSGPWIRPAPTDTLVIFGTDEGDLDAFAGE